MDQHQFFEVPKGLEAIPAHMSAALQEMRLVTEELRIQGCPHEANQMGRLCLEFINRFHDALDRIRGLVAVSQNAQPIPGMYPLPSIAAGRILETMNEQSSEMRREQGHPEPAEDDQGQQESPHLPVPTAAPTQVPVAEASWAHIASASVRRQVSEQPASRANRGGRHNAGHSVTMRTASRRATVLVAKGSSSGAASHENDRNGNGILEDGKAGVVVVKGPIETIKNIFSYISARIHEGAIYDMSMNKDQEIVVIFQYALHAQIFVDRNTESVATRGESVFGLGDWSVTLSKPMDWTDTLRRMAHPHRERRRLTFVKSRLFADNISFLKWVREVQDVAGAANVDFVWAFNTGNATAVFFSVAIARKVMQTFSHWRANRGCYEDLIVSYSSDPCEKDLQLTTQLRYHMQPAHRHFEKLPPNENGGRHRYYQGRK
ncbi:hypothetical protein TMatcc_008789 [Talaromyces marneffei ATCC 18224]|nr:hypothetical protein EYB25_006963 [Talaromyces marneffei]